MVQIKESSKVEKIGLKEKFSYGGGDLASNLVMVLTGTFLTFFYTDAIHLDIGVIGIIILVSRIFDGISDIFMGFIMDKTKSKHGKARPWLLWMAVPFGVGTVLVMTVPDIADIGKYIYVFITYNLITTILYTAINIPYGALNSLITRDQQQRATVNIFRMAMAQIGALLINAFTLPLINLMGGTTNQKAWIYVALIYGVIATTLFLICFMNTKERVHVVQAPENRNISLGRTFTLLMKNKYWLIIVAVWVVTVLGMSMSGAVGVYYAKYILNNEMLFGYFVVCQSIPAILLIPFMGPVIARIGKRNLALIGCGISILGQIILCTSPTNLAIIYTSYVIKGIGSVGMMATIFAMVADTIEYGQWKTGVRVEGMLYSATTFGAKIGGGVGMVVATSILGAAGYIGTAAIQTEMAIKAISNLFLYAPLIFLCITPILYIFYKLDKEYPGVMKDLAKREEKIARQ